MFNDPSGSETEQYQMLRYLIELIDCTPPLNPDGTQASIKFSFYSLTYAPVQAALTAAAQRGVSVQALTNSHSDKYSSWRELSRTLGADTNAINFATTCWQGCLTPRNPAVPGGPTSWYGADATTLTSNTVIFSDRSRPGLQPIVAWRYDFGDGTFADGPGPHTKTYSVPGTYKTSLTVTDAAGLTHTTTGEKTLPDNMEPMYPSLHSKIYLFSTVGQGANARQWVSAYSSGNPTYQQSRKGFNNLNIAVGDKPLHDIFTTYFADLVKGSRGELMTPNYFRTFATPGQPRHRRAAHDRPPRPADIGGHQPGDPQVHPVQVQGGQEVEADGRAGLDVRAHPARRGLRPLAPGHAAGLQRGDRLHADEPAHQGPQRPVAGERGRRGDGLRLRRLPVDAAQQGHRHEGEQGQARQAHGS